MGQDRPVMEDDGSAISRTCKMPSFIGPLEAEEKVKSPLGISKVEASLRNLDRRVSRRKLSQDEGEKGAIVEEEEQQGGVIEEEQDAEDNDNNNCNGGGRERRGADIMEFLRASLLASKFPSDCASQDARMQGEKPGHAGVENEHPSAEVAGGLDLVSLSDIKHESCGTSVKGHVNCAVYCIANERHRDTVGAELRDNDPTSGSGEGLVLHTVDELVDPLREASLIRRSSRQAAADVDAQPCRVCLEDKTIAPLPCCRKLVCDECLTLYVSSQVQAAKAHIRCPISECGGMLESAAVVSRLAGEDALRYRYFLELSQLDASTKPCPRCRHFTSVGRSSPGRSEHKYKIQCGSCQFVWCFKCHTPWHQGIKCRDYRKGDKQLRSWACVIERGQRNAQKCPKCKIHIQRTEGCDHMVCTQCNTNFCYRCGQRYRQLRYFGDHTSNLSVFGCKYRYLPDKPHLRRFIRGSICGLKVLLAPVVVLLVLVFGAVALVIGNELRSGPHWKVHSLNILEAKFSKYDFLSQKYTTLFWEYYNFLLEICNFLSEKYTSLS
ncbi:probable E3 ubiquitin-protein ligase RNF217 isoform X1 [Phycodurus eques]|uniref:probable E3 ubiquitin-protein ligase RNF217 isoform X1 n=1 Tax=Phycodurus eques TaxID=693459 RepID=UPI002ACD65E6|nr:probable E3 ubiquitin-protein ligase RNF217 isoform X1 [Phycodurus eques]